MADLDQKRLSSVHAVPVRTVLLRHDLADGKTHVDWMIAQDSAGADRLVSFRLDRRVDHLKTGEAADAERIDDHRPVYLVFEGEISGGRGVVSRLCAGDVERWESVDHSISENQCWTMSVCWHEQAVRRIRQELRLIQRELQRWIVICDTMISE